jgi:hypothetical protein
LEVVELGDRSITWHAEDRFQVREITLEVAEERPGSRVTQETRASFRKPPGIAGWIYPILARRTIKSQFRMLAERFG